MHSAKVLLDSIAPQLFTAQQPMHAFIVFGSTASRPSELYSLAFPATGNSDPRLTLQWFQSVSESHMHHLQASSVALLPKLPERCGCIVKVVLI